MLGFIKRNCSRDFKTATLRRLYTALVRPHVDYATVIWNTNNYHITNTDYVECVQRRFVKLICIKGGFEYHRSDYVDACSTLNLTTLYKRRFITDMIFLYKIINCHQDSNLISLLNFRVPSRNTRNTDTFVQCNGRINVFKNSCINRLQTFYNSNSFKHVDIFHLTLTNFKSALLNVINDL